MAILATSNGTPAAQGATQGRMIPFTKAALEHVEPMFDHSVTLTAAQQVIGPFDVPAYGYLRGIFLKVTSSGGSDADHSCAADPDGVWNVLAEVYLRDVNGGPLVGPITGYDLFLIDKWGGYDFTGNPAASPAYDISDVDDGNFAFMLYIPVEIIARSAYGALPNMNAAATYKLALTINSANGFLNNIPDTVAPTIRVRGWVSAWTKPSDADPAGNSQEVAPPYVGTTQYWSKTVLNTAVGANILRFPRVGNYIRNLIVVTRDDTNARDGANHPPEVRFLLDSHEIRNEADYLRRHIMWSLWAYPTTLITAADHDEAVIVYPFHHDFDYHPGGELGDLYLPTAQSSRLELAGTWANDAGTIDILTNDITPAPAYVRSAGR